MAQIHIIPMPGQGFSRGYVAERKAVPIDGPLGWFRPETAAHFTALGLNVPDYLWLCQDTGTSLVASMGGINFSQVLTPLYQQTVTGWACKFAGPDGTSGQGFRISTNAAFSLAIGESAAMLCYASAADAVPGIASALMRYQAGAPTGGAGHAHTNGNLYAFHNGVQASNSAGSGLRVNHFGIDTVHQYAWFRRADIDSSGLMSELESVTNTHDEVAIATPTLQLGASTSVTNARYCWVAVYKGTNAEFDIGTYLATLRGG